MIWFQFVILVVGFVMLMKGADWFVEGAAKLADKFGIPQIVIGLTVVAFGTSLPEAAVSITSALSGNVDITVGNVMGSNIMNVLLILGITSLVCSIPVGKTSYKIDIPFVIIATILVSLMGIYDNWVSRIEGIILVLIMAGYIIHLSRRALKGEEDLDDIPGGDRKIPLWKMIIFIVIGGAMITFGSNLTVSSATNIATSFGVSERIIGLTIIAFGTSLPELVTSVTAAVKKQTDIAVGNIVGSNIFNILFVIGVTSVITPVAYQAKFFFDSVIAIATVVLLYVCVLPKKRLNKLTGIIMLVCYAAYFYVTMIYS